MGFAPEQPDESLGRAGIPVGKEMLGAQPPRVRVNVSKWRLAIWILAAALGLAVGFLGLADETPDVTPSETTSAP